MEEGMVATKLIPAYNNLLLAAIRTVEQAVVSVEVNE